MEDVFPKFIVEDGRIVIGKVSFHRELALNIRNVRGGGWFKYMAEQNAFLLYGRSEDFGAVSLEALEPIVQAGLCGNFHNETRYDDFTFFYSPEGRLEDALVSYVEIPK